jgi:hypothetical protein
MTPQHSQNPEEEFFFGFGERDWFGKSFVLDIEEERIFFREPSTNWYILLSISTFSVYISPPTVKVKGFSSSLIVD